MGSFFLKVFVFQIIVAGVVIFILKKILEHQLVELAIKKFEYLKLTSEQEKVDEIILVFAKGRIEEIQARINLLVGKKFKSTPKITVVLDKKIKGGLVIRFDDVVIDYSLIGRLKESRIIR